MNVKSTGMASSVSVSSTEAPTRFLDVGPRRFAYRKFGNEAGLPIVFLQHFTGTMDNWDPILLDRLAEDSTLILIDNIGVGQSTGQHRDNIASMATDVLEFLAAMNAPLVHVFGFSMGGFVAQEMAARDSNRINKLVLAGTGPRGGVGMAEYTADVTAIMTNPDYAPPEKLLRLFFEPTESSQSLGQAWLNRLVSREPSPADEVVGAQLQAIQSWGAVHEARAYLKHISHPVLVINGRNDIVVPTINSYLLQQELPNARLLILPDSGHGAIFQFSQEVADVVAKFFTD